MPPQSHRDLIASQGKSLHERLRKSLAPGQPYALVDFPNHANCGDSAIWLGAISILRALSGDDPAYACSVSSFSSEELLQQCPEGPIFISGGGNLGDIWHGHQALRETILQRFPDRPVVQLPQSIHFRDERKKASFARLASQHPNFLLLVRDRPSLAFAANIDVETDLCPDMAFGLGAMERDGPADISVLALLRADREQQQSAEAVSAAQTAGYVCDWPVEDAKFGTENWKKQRLQLLLRGVFSQEQRRLRYMHAIAEKRLSRGTSILSRGKVVITDRLHGHILSFLMGIPSVILDNSYGKVSRYAEVWTAGSPLVSLKPKATEITQTAQRLLEKA